MRSLITLFLVGCVAAGSSNYSWKSNQEYRYQYNSQVLSGIPELNSQYAGVRLSAEIRVQPREDKTCIVKIENPRFKSYNEVLDLEIGSLGEHKGFADVSKGEEENISGSVKSWLEAPFTVYHKRGLVQKIQTGSSEPQFIVNLKKAVTAQFQQDLEKAESREQGNQIIRGGEGLVVPEYRSRETSPIGNCETIYTINKLPAYMVREFEEVEGRQLGQSQSSQACEGKDYYEIIKSKNIDNCSERPVFHRSVGVNTKTDGSGSSSIPEHSSLTRTIICGTINDHIIRKSTSTNGIHISAAGRFETNEMVHVDAKSILLLVSVERAQQELSGPSSPKGYPSLIFEYSSEGRRGVQSAKEELLQQGGQQKQGKNAQTSLPDLKSSPKTFKLIDAAEREIVEEVGQIFAEIVELSEEKLSETSKNKKDVAHLSVVAQTGMRQLSYEGLRSLEKLVESKVGGAGQEKKSIIEKLFYDLVSSASTNPSIMLIKDKVMSGDMIKEPASWSWIISNAFRNIQTPTEELLGELVQLLKSRQINENRIIRASYILGLTELVNKACVNHVTMKTEYPYKMYGQMCSENSSVIKEELLPYLSQKLQESSSSDMNSVITYVNALGNLGLKESAEELLKVVEGKISSSPHPRSVAVYKLIRPASENPDLYKPVFLAIIENSAENEQVRMAAITAFTYCSPSAADMQRLAIRSWFEPSRQVSSYIYSTLKTLSQIPEELTRYAPLQEKARITLHLARPNFEGLQSSHNLQMTQFVEAIRSAVSHKLQWTTSEESFFPRSIFASANLKGRVSDIDALEAAYYIQGAESVIEKLQELYTSLVGPDQGSDLTQNKIEIEELMRKLGVQGSKSVAPEAHLTLKFMGLQKLYSFDSKYVSEIVQEITREVIDSAAKYERGVANTYFKILDLASADFLLPTESGMLALISGKSPTVAYNKAEIKTKEHSTVEMKVKGTANYKRQVSAGIVSAITNKFYGCGVETSVHIANRLISEVSYKNGQVQVSIRNSEEPEFQSEKAFLEIDVHPYTTVFGLGSLKNIWSHGDRKTVKSHHARKQRETNVGKPFGIDLIVKEDSEESLMDVYKFWEDLKVNVPVFLTSLPTPICTSSRRTTITVAYNPRTSKVKQLDFTARIGYGVKEGKQQEIEEFPIQSVDTEIRAICSEIAPEQTESCRQELEGKKIADNDVIETCEQKKLNKEEQDKCMFEKQLNKEGKKYCQKQMQRQQGKSIEEAEQKCAIQFELAEQRQEARQQLKSVLAKLEGGKAISVSMETKLRGRQESEDRIVSTHLVVAEKREKENREETEVSIKVALKTPALRKPMDVEIQANGKVVRPSSRWSREEILGQDLTSEVEIKGELGLRGEMKQRIGATISALRSEEQKERVRESREYERCSRDESEGRKLSKSCKQTREEAASLDKVRAKLSLPRDIAENRFTEMATEISKFVYLPYITSQKSVPKVQHGDDVEYQIEAHVSDQGQTISARVSGNGEEVEFKHVRLGAVAKGLLPINTEETFVTRVLQKLTAYSAPSSCAVESGKIETFDRLEYEYTLNDCEHVVFAEASSSPRVVVTTKKSPQEQIVKMVVDGHKYELEIKKQSRYSRNNQAIVKVNGETKAAKSVDEQEQEQRQEQGQYHAQRKNFYADRDTYVTNFRDGVYSIVSRKYGVEVVADGERMEVKSYQHQFRNQVTGLCGDLNGERTADLKSGKKCLLSTPKLAASSFMVEDGKCRGISQGVKSELSREQSTCVKKIEVATRVSEVFQVRLSSKPRSELVHLIEESEGKICFSKEMVRICQGSYPKDIKAEEVRFTCKSGVSAEALKRRVLAGEQVEELQRLPTSRTETVYVPSEC